MRAACLGILCMLTACGAETEPPEPVNVEAGIERSVQDVRAAREASATPLPQAPLRVLPAEE